MKRKSSGTYWTVNYSNNIAIGNFATFKELLNDIVTNPDTYATGGMITEKAVN